MGGYTEAGEGVDTTNPIALRAKLTSIAVRLQGRAGHEVGKNGEVKDRNLYDYKTDPMETKNLADEPEYKSIIDRLSTSLRREAKGCLLLKK